MIEDFAHARSDIRQRTENDEDIAGANGGSYTPIKGGSYSCRVTATNAAGSTAQTSSALDVPQNPRCETLGAKRKRQRRGLDAATTEAKQSQIQAKIKDGLPAPVNGKPVNAEADSGGAGTPAETPAAKPADDKKSEMRPAIDPDNGG